MSRKEGVALASRTMALLLTVWALTDMSYLPGSLNSFLHYTNQVATETIANQYWQHYYLISLGFLIVRIVGYSLMAMWLYKGGPVVDQLFLPAPDVPDRNTTRKTDIQ